MEHTGLQNVVVENQINIEMTTVIFYECET